MFVQLSEIDLKISLFEGCPTLCFSGSKHRWGDLHLGCFRGSVFAINTCQGAKHVGLVRGKCRTVKQHSPQLIPFLQGVLELGWCFRDDLSLCKAYWGFIYQHAVVFGYGVSPKRVWLRIRLLPLDERNSWSRTHWEPASANTPATGVRILKG